MKTSVIKLEIVIKNKKKKNRGKAAGKTLNERKRSNSVLISRSYIEANIFLVSAIARPGFRPLGQVRVQLRMVWQRYTLMLLSRAALRSAVRSSRESASQR